jgi:hypothetical protein
MRFDAIDGSRTDLGRHGKVMGQTAAKGNPVFEEFSGKDVPSPPYGPTFAHSISHRPSRSGRAAGKSLPKV